MSDNSSKTKRQEQGIQCWRTNKGLGTLKYVPRFGKTRVAEMIIERLLEKNPTAVIVAVAHNDITRKNLEENLPPFIIVVTIHKLLNSINDFLAMNIDLLIVDEIHKFIKTDGIRVLKLTAKYKLGLTGDNLSKFDRAILREHGFPVVDIIEEEEALMHGWISDYVEYNLPVDIEEHKKEKYVMLSEKITELGNTYSGCYKIFNNFIDTKILTNDLSLLFGLYSGISHKDRNRNKSLRIPPEMVRDTLAIAMGWTKDMPLETARQKQINEFFNPVVLHEVGRVYTSVVQERNNLIINSRNKMQMAIDIILRNPVPTIVFSESTRMATDIAWTLGKEAIEYHSAVETKFMINPQTGEYFTAKNGNPIKFGATRLKALAIEGINNGIFKYLCTAKALNEGVNLPILQQVITTGGTTDPGTHLQRIARGKTIDKDNPDKITKIINIYIRDFIYNGEVVISRDAAKLRTRQADTLVYWIDTIDEIFTTID